MISKGSVASSASESFLTLSSSALEKILLLDDLASEEYDVFQSCMKWATAECQRQKLVENQENIRSVLGNLFFKIRFPAMTLEQFSNKVIPMNVLTNEEGFLLFQQYNCEAKPTVPFVTTKRTNPFSD